MHPTRRWIIISLAVALLLGATWYAQETLAVFRVESHSQKDPWSCDDERAVNEFADLQARSGELAAARAAISKSGKPIPQLAQEQLDSAPVGCVIPSASTGQLPPPSRHYCFPVSGRSTVAAGLRQRRFAAITGADTAITHTAAPVIAIANMSHTP